MERDVYDDDGWYINQSMPLSVTVPWLVEVEVLYLSSSIYRIQYIFLLSVSVLVCATELSDHALALRIPATNIHILLGVG
jgi:hypothetical protein